MARFYLGVAERDYVQAAKAAGVCLFAGGKAAPVEKVQPGDKVVYYAPKVSHQGAPLQAFVALGAVTGAGVRRKDDWPDHPGFTAWVRDCVWERDTRDVPIRAMLESLDFIASPDEWEVSIRGSQREIGCRDYARIAGAMLGSSP